METCADATGQLSCSWTYGRRYTSEGQKLLRQLLNLQPGLCRHILACNSCFNNGSWKARLLFSFFKIDGVAELGIQDLLQRRHLGNHLHLLALQVVQLRLRLFRGCKMPSHDLAQPTRCLRHSMHTVVVQTCNAQRIPAVIFSSASDTGVCTKPSPRLYMTCAQPHSICSQCSAVADRGSSPHAHVRR